MLRTGEGIFEDDNIKDEINELINRTIYKLENLR